MTGKKSNPNEVDFVCRSPQMKNPPTLKLRRAKVGISGEKSNLRMDDLKLIQDFIPT
jgi:hypothetical protein